MKTVMFKVSGEAAGGDLAVVAYTTPRGGMSYATYKIKGPSTTAALVNGEAVKQENPGDSWGHIAMGLADAINNAKGEFCGEQFHAVSQGDLLVVSCTDAVSDVTFISQIQGEGTGKIEQLNAQPQVFNRVLDL